MTEPRPYNPQPQSRAEDEITFKDVFRTISGLLGSWPYLTFGAIVGLIIAFFVNKYTLNTYEIDAKIAVEQVDNPLADAAGSLSLNFSWGGSSILKTTVALLQSYSHNMRVAMKLGWETKHFVEGRLNRREEYEPPYYTVEFDKSHPQLLGLEYRMELQPEGFDLTF